MKAGIAALVAGYVLSQFYRVFLAVLSPDLIAELGVTASQLSRASGLFLLGFAGMQLPIGTALDRIGPRRLTTLLLGLCGGGGAALFALAQGPLAIQIAMALIGMGCAPVLMASYYILARMAPAHMFATLGAAILGAGSVGNLLSTLPLAWMVTAVGWRPVLAGAAVVTVSVAAVILAVVPDPPRHAPGTTKANYLTILANRDLWPLLPLLGLNYTVIGLTGLWIGPFFADRYGLDARGIGAAALVIGIAMIAGSVLYGPLDRVFRTRKWVILTGNTGAGLLLVTLAAWPGAPLSAAVALLAGTLFLGTSYAQMMAHARAFAPPQVAGRAVALFNFFSIGGAGVLQYFSARVHAIWPDWSALFLFFGLPLLAACAVYAFSRDNLQ